MTTPRPTIAAIIPTLNGSTAALEQALQAQTMPPDELEVVRGVQPSGKARNLGAQATRGEILLFIDDDALPGQDELIEQLVTPLCTEPRVGVTGAARVLPSDAPWFQRRVAAEIPRTVNEVPAAPLETNPPLSGYGHSLITTTCAAVRREVYEEAGGFSETLTRGVDTDFFYRVHRRNYRFLMMPDVYVEHPAPASLPALLRKFYWYGVGYGEETQQRPQQHMGFRLPHRWQQLAFLAAATLWLVPNIFVLYSFGYPYWRLGFRPLKALSTYAVAWGYVRGWQRDVTIATAKTI
jgi:cellulose synthase/poly-beta-1,6-N-acetylglucosamine synthase-like glycosyltransferase